MIVEITAGNAPRAYAEALQQMRVSGVEEDTMRGPVLRIPHPVFLTISRPWERVLFDPTRDANPFFHCMEFVWMMAGQQDANWIKFFNSNMEKSANDGIIHGAYGRRWIKHFGFNQIISVCNQLFRSPNSRRAIIAMWDSYTDLESGYSDYPCNTHIMVTIDKGKLNFTVINRSNDLIWGMLGANVVHMTMLQEVMAAELGVPIGKYQVFTNNLHMYTSLPKFTEYLHTYETHDPYPMDHDPIFSTGESLARFMVDCEAFLAGNFNSIENLWLLTTARPIYEAYKAHKAKDARDAHKWALTIEAADWRMACLEWLARRT